MSAHIYQSLLRSLKKWPVDLTKKGRDFGEIIRRRISEGFPQGETSQVDAAKWTPFANHLENIASDKSLKQYPRSLQSNATGLSVEECREIVSTDFLNSLKENKKD